MTFRHKISMSQSTNFHESYRCQSHLEAVSRGGGHAWFDVEAEDWWHFFLREICFGSAHMQACDTQVLYWRTVLSSTT